MREDLAPSTASPLYPREMVVVEVEMEEVVEEVEVVVVQYLQRSVPQSVKTKAR